MKKRSFGIVLVLLLLLSVPFGASGEECEHSWSDLSETEHKCEKCEKVEPHSYENGVCAICSAVCQREHVCAQACPVCGVLLAHLWKDGVCESCGAVCQNAEAHSCAAACDVCGYMAEHLWVNGVCTECGAVCDSESHPLDCAGGKCPLCKLAYPHLYDQATGLCVYCEARCPDFENHNCMTRCQVCDYIGAHEYVDFGKDHYCGKCGLVGQHAYTAAASAHRCDLCGREEAHAWHEAVCAVCGAVCAHQSTNKSLQTVSVAPIEGDARFHAASIREREVCSVCGAVIAEREHATEQKHSFDASGCACGYTDGAYKLMEEARLDLRNRATPVTDGDQRYALELLDVYLTDFINERANGAAGADDAAGGMRFTIGGERELDIAYHDGVLLLVHTKYNAQSDAVTCTLAVLDPSGESVATNWLLEASALSDSTLEAFMADESLTLNVWSVDEEVFALDDSEALGKLAGVEGGAENATGVDVQAVLSAPNDGKRVVTLMLCTSDAGTPEARLLIDEEE